MKIFGVSGSSLICLFWIISCASTIEKERVGCAYPDNPRQEAPIWVCSKESDKYFMSTVGYSERSLAGYQFMREIALLSARANLAHQVQVYTQKIIQQYIVENDVANAAIMDKATSTVIPLITDASLIRSKMLESVISDKGSLYVLVTIDKEDVYQIVKSAILSSIQYNGYVWLQFRTQESLEELAEVISHSQLKESNKD